MTSPAGLCLEYGNFSVLLKPVFPSSLGINITNRSNNRVKKKMDEKTQIELEAAAFRHLVGFLQEKTDVQNIDLMNLAGFCRNCLSKWYLAAAEERGIELDYDEVREIIYGMPYAEWKDKYQKEASQAQLDTFADSKNKQ